jgi:hypothetical protein
LIARWRRRCAPTLTLTRATILHAIATLLHGLLKLLLLSIGHDGFQLLVRIHHRGAHLLVALLLAQSRIVLNGVHLLLLILQYRQHLLLLILGQVQHLGQMTQLVLGAWRLTMLHGLFARGGLLVSCSLRGRSRGSVLRKHRRRNTKSHSENSNSRVHSSEKFTRIHLGSFLHDTRRSTTNP